MSRPLPVRFGVAGLGGYAGYISDRLLEDMRRTHPSAELVAACDPAIERFTHRSAFLRKNGIQLLPHFDDLLASDIEAVWLPLPIDLHRAFTERALAAGKAVLCEKPAAGSVDDVDAMIAARDCARLPVAVGFQDIYEPAVAALKNRILAGEFGAPRCATVIGCWPRDEGYFSRNDWAGRHHRNGVWVMDSPVGNALAHFLHLALVLLGPSEQEAASPLEVAAELYRANRIESYDTCSLRFTLSGNVQLFVCYTHACDRNVDPVVTMEFERATVRYVAGMHIEIIKPDASEVITIAPEPRVQMLRTFQNWVRNGQFTAPGGTLETARAHVLCVNAAAEATPVLNVPADAILTSHSGGEISLHAIQGIIAAMQHCIRHKCLLHESGLLPWTHAPGRLRLDGYQHFAGPVKTKAELTLHPRKTPVAPATI